MRNRAKCSECGKFYKEKDKECIPFIAKGVPMICYECTKKHNKEFEERINRQYEKQS